MKSIAITIFLALGLFVLGSTADAQSKKIGMKSARAIASKKAAGKIVSGELENEHGKWIYSFDIRNSKGKNTEVNVDAYTGKVIGVEHESAKKEAAEARDEKKGKN